MKISWPQDIVRTNGEYAINSGRISRSAQSDGSNGRPLTPGRSDAGRELYESRQQLLAGLWQPVGPPWHELSPEAQERWGRNAQEAAPDENGTPNENGTLPGPVG